MKNITRTDWYDRLQYIPENRQADFLRRELKKYETKIVKITGNNPGDIGLWERNSRNMEKLKELCAERCSILNTLFRATPDEIRRFEQQNDLLYRLTCKLHDKTASVYRELLKSRHDSEDVYVEGMLTFDYIGEDSVLSLKDDDYYGSDFRTMIWIQTELMHATWSEVHHIVKSYSPDDAPEMSDKKLGLENTLDDGSSWAEGLMHNPALEHICICHAMHDIYDHKDFSIPDLLRLNDFRCSVTVTYEHRAHNDKFE